MTIIPQFMKKVLLIIGLLIGISPIKAADFDNSVEIAYLIGNTEYTQFIKIGYVLGLKTGEKGVIEFSTSMGRGNSLGLMTWKYTNIGGTMHADGFNNYSYTWFVTELMIGYKYYFTNKDIAPFISINFGTDILSKNGENKNIDGFTFDNYMGLRFKMEDDNAFYVQAGLCNKPYQVEVYSAHNDAREFYNYTCAMFAIKAGFAF